MELLFLPVALYRTSSAERARGHSQPFSKALSKTNTNISSIHTAVAALKAKFDNLESRHEEHGSCLEYFYESYVHFV